MHFRIFLQQLRRGTKRTLLYTLILMAVSAFLVMSLNLYKNSTANLQSAEETYTTIALMELYGDVDERGNLVEPFSEDYAGNKAVAVEGYDISEITEASGVYDWDLRKKYAAHIEGEIALNTDYGWIKADRDIFRFTLAGDKPVEIPIAWSNQFEERGQRVDIPIDVNIIDNAASCFNYESLFGVPFTQLEIDIGYGEGIAMYWDDCEEYREQVRQLNRSENSETIILYPGVEYIATTWTSSGWVETEDGVYQYVGTRYDDDYKEGLPLPQYDQLVGAMKNDLPRARFYPNFLDYGADIYVNYGGSRDHISAYNGSYTDPIQPFPIQRWDDVQNDPELKAYFESAAKALKIQYSVFNVELTNDIEGVPAFHIGGAYLKDGRYITSEEYENGAKVCIISSALAIKQGWELGDKLSMDFFEFSAFPSVNYDYSVNQAIWNEEVEGFFDTGEFEIVGIIGQTQFTGNSGISKSTMEQPWNNIYIPKNAVNNRTPQEELPVHGALLTLWLENGSVDRFMADMEALGLTETKEGQYNPSFIFYDQGYSQIQPGLEAMHSTAQLLLVLSAVLMVVTSILLAYFYAQNQKQSVGIFRMLGGSKLKSLTAVLLCIILIALLGAGIGAAAGHVLTQTVSAKIIESNLSQSEAAAAFQAFVLQSGSEAQELATEAHLNLSLSAGGITILLPVVLVLIFVIMYINKEPRELLPKSGH